MKNYVILVAEDGGSSRLESPMALIDIDDVGIAYLRDLRDTVTDIAAKARLANRAFAGIMFHTLDVNWLLVSEEEDDKLYMAASTSEDGYKEIPEDVHDQRLRTAEENRDELMLRTESDYISAGERGIFFVCEEKHSYTRYETNFIPWYVLFDEPEPQASVIPSRL